MEFVPSEFERFIAGAVKTNGVPVEILDVGGGAVCRVPLTNARVTVLDGSPDALERNDAAGIKLVGDAQSFDYGDRRFDIAVFWNVLEHVPCPDAALERACDRLNRNGLIVIRGPELNSLKALVTRYTPHWLHVLFYRWVLGIRDAGRNGRPPCPVEHNREADRDAIESLLRKLGFKIQYEQHYVGDQVTELRRFSSVGYLLYSGVASLVRLLTFSRYGRRETEFILVGRRID